MKRIIFLMLILFRMCAVNAQSIELFVITPAGNFMSNQDVSLSATMGEVMTETYSSAEIILTQGFQQSGLAVETYMPETGSEWNIMVFPNPVTDELKIDFYGDYQGKINIEMFDLKGRKLLHKALEKSVSKYVYTLDVNSFEKGVYILNITTSDLKINHITRIEIQ